MTGRFAGRRVGIVGLEHETNTFRDGPTPLADFSVVRGSDLEVERGKRTYAGGMFDGIEALGSTAVPLMVATAQPSGAIDADAYRALRDEIVAAVRAAEPDAVVCQLHGAAVAVGIDDVEADLGRALRAALGSDVPIVGSLDLHANLRPETLAPYDALSCVKFYPHTDMYDRGREAAEWIAHRWEGRRLDTAVVPMPWLLLPTATTVDGPARAIELCDAAETRPGVLDATFVHGFPLADGPQVGASVLVTTIAGEADAAAIARHLAEEIWRLRDRCTVEMFDVDDAVAVAMDERDRALVEGDVRPVVLAETSDNPGGGGVGDGTHLLRSLIAAGAPAVFASVLDPATAAAAHAAGVGARIAVELGGRLDASSGEPIVATAEVLALSEGRYELRGVGWDIRLGPSALLSIGSVDVVVTSGNQQVFDDGPFTLHGVDVRRRPLVALKSANHFRAYYGRIARRIVPVLGPGLSHQSTTLPWERVRRPIWPLDDLPDDLPT
jgi:microcystin degradation protein MlrC